MSERDRFVDVLGERRGAPLERPSSCAPPPELSPLERLRAFTSDLVSFDEAAKPDRLAEAHGFTYRSASGLGYRLDRARARAPDERLPSPSTRADRTRRGRSGGAERLTNGLRDSAFYALCGPMAAHAISAAGVRLHNANISRAGVHDVGSVERTACCLAGLPRSSSCVR